jgi:type IV secretory pathway VirB10-like protein
MRRPLNIAFFLAAIAVGVSLYWRHADPTARPAVSEAPTLPQSTTVPPPRLAPPPPSPNPAAAAAPRATDEPALMQQLRALVKSDPGKAEALAREDRQRFPESADADERDALLVDTLINQQRIGAARSETYYYFDHHPGGRFTEHLFAMTGVHPTPSGPHR